MRTLMKGLTSNYSNLLELRSAVVLQSKIKFWLRSKNIEFTQKTIALWATVLNFTGFGH
jgi:hypothetical protein